MSDFIFSAYRRPSGLLARELQGIYHEDVPIVFEFHGTWGSLAVTHNLHVGFEPLETETHLCVIIGGPILTFTTNRFLAGTDLTIGTRLLLNKWNSSEGISWADDLTGPFVALRLDKVRGQLEVVTDLMAFIPLFQSKGLSKTIVGTHVDVVAKVAECYTARDPASIADFILHGAVTYPYTFYPGVTQLPPASIHQWTLYSEALSQSHTYWKPLEENPYKTLEEAADAVRDGMQAYVTAVTEGMDRVALFLSGGEDSRTILAMIPRRCERDTFIFLDAMNREGHVAQAAATAYGANFKILLRGELRYLDVLPQCSDLVGSGSEYKHVHSYGLHIDAGLKDYKAVFGGFLADVLLKGIYVKKARRLQRFPFLPVIKSRDQRKRQLGSFGFLSKNVLQNIKHRNEQHERLVGKFRTTTSIHEWFDIWPMSMRNTMPNLYGSRRLFPCYEPFMANCVVRTSAAVPQHWKLNRRLFQRVAQPLLKPARHLLHANGWMPYYPWYTNIVIHGAVWLWRGVESRMGWVKGNQGPWNEWELILSSDAWKNAVNERIASALLPEDLFTVSLRTLFEGKQLTTAQKINLIQVLYQCQGASQ